MASIAKSSVRYIARRPSMLGWSMLGVGLAVNWRLTSWPFPSCALSGSFRSLPRLSQLSRSLATVSDLFSTTTTSSMAHIQPPQPPPQWNHTAEDILTITREALAKCQATDDRVGALKPEECTFESVFRTLALSDAESESTLEPLFFYQNVSPSKDLRDASNAAEVLAREFSIESSMRIDVFQAKLAAERNIKESGKWEKLDAEEKRLVEKMVLDGKRAGLALPEEKREELKQLQKELSQTCLDFSKNFNEEKGVVTFTLDELKGVPADIVSGYTKRTENSVDVYDVTHKTPDIFPLFKYAENPATRQRAHESYDARLAINEPLLTKALDLRRKIASTLGYKTWADYVTEVKMAKSAKNVTDFLDDLEAKLRPVGLSDLKNLTALKEADHNARNIPYDGNFYIWDYRFYDRVHVEKTLSLDDALVKEYFPVSYVVPAILEIYQNLLGVRFEKMEGGSVWHEDVQQFSVWEADARDEKGFVGYCYLDLFPRESKYSHAAVWPLLPGYTKADGSRAFPIAAMVANLAKPTPERPALMRHDDVVTFFHEMGHVFHGLLSRTRYQRFHGTSVARDFVEAPSQMLENWCWEPKVLEKMSSHFEKKEPLSQELIQKIVQSRYVNIGLFDLRQIFFGKFDIKVHTDQKPTDYTKLWNDLRESVSLVKGGKYTPGQASFAHITGGYDAGYYGYMYSLVFAADMYATVFKRDPLDPKLGAKYRSEILRPGGSREELDSLKEFLGRPPRLDAYTEEIFGSGKTGAEAASHL